ncbi:hypothetical protein QFZ75_007996 [Streptomyces sp. V3I8]|uniref:hypothetical protein n=1 Tax=Streptomyces sp. V3I8 TaxID=3042279 RepID=UPI002784E978|nr:hypothetical protein [Streptomyces sp. V3I8]MDQ1041494.1 hypothetical protein [Streptomyces sp. V3I8]
MSGEQAPAGPAPATGPPDPDGGPRPRIPPRGYAIAVATLVVGLFGGFSIASDSIPPARLPSVADTLQGATAGATIPGEGWSWIGKDAEPGLYRSLGNSDRCLWTRATDATGEPGSVKAVSRSRGTTYVHLDDGDFFHADGCNTWHLMGQGEM